MTVSLSTAAPPPPLDPVLADELRRVLGPGSVVTDPDALIVYESDVLTAYRVRPRAVLLPANTLALAAAVRLLVGAGVPYVPRGAGTGLSGGALAFEQAVIVSVARLDRILEIDAPNRRARVEAGVVNARLAAALEPYGLRYAPDPSSQYACTLGGNVAENASGPHGLKYGATVNHVSALTVVLPDGEVVDLGGAGELVGYDLVGLFTGSEGTFGIATEIELRLLPLPEAVETLLATFPSAEDAGRAVSAVIGAGLVPAALELMDQALLRAVAAHDPSSGLPVDPGAALLVEFEGSRLDVAAEAERAQAVCAAQGAERVEGAADAESRARLWHARKKCYGALGRLARDLFVQDVVVPRSRLAEAMAAVNAACRRHQVKVATVAHAGDGNLHPTLLFDRRDESSVRRVEAASREILEACVAMGGTITGEHGVGVDKREELSLVVGAVELETMCAVRAVFDPRGLANPGKVLPERACREWAGRAGSAKLR